MDEAAIKIVIVDDGGTSGGAAPRQQPTEGTRDYQERTGPAARGGSFVGDAATIAAGQYIGNRASGGKGGGPTGPGKAKSGDDSEPSRGLVPIGQATNTGTALATRYTPSGPTIERMIGQSEPWSGALSRSILDRTSAASALAKPSSAGFGMAEIGSAASMAAKGLGVAGLSAVAMVGAFKLLKSEVDSATASYHMLNGTIAANRAMIEVRGLLGDMRRANQIAPNLNRFDNTTARMDQAWKDIKTDFLDIILHYINPVLEGISEWVTSIAKEIHALRRWLIGNHGVDAAARDDFLFETAVERFFGLDRFPGFQLRPAGAAAAAQGAQAPAAAPLPGGFGDVLGRAFQPGGVMFGKRGFFGF